MAKKHPFAEILHAIADGKEIQFLDDQNNWHLKNPCLVFDDIVAGRFNPNRYRVKPNVIHINGHEVPEPIKEIPSSATTYYFPNFDDCFSYATSTWTEHELDYFRLNNGLIHLTREAAILHASALLSFTR